MNFRQGQACPAIVLEAPPLEIVDGRVAVTATLALATGLRRFVGLSRLVAANQLNQFLGLSEAPREAAAGPEAEDESGPALYGPAQESFDRLLVPEVAALRRGLSYEIHRERAALLRLEPSDRPPAGRWYANPLLASLWSFFRDDENCHCHFRTGPLHLPTILGDGTPLKSLRRSRSRRSDAGANNKG